MRICPAAGGPRPPAGCGFPGAGLSLQMSRFETRPRLRSGEEPVTPLCVKRSARPCAGRPGDRSRETHYQSHRARPCPAYSASARWVASPATPDRQRTATRLPDPHDRPIAADLRYPLQLAADRQDLDEADFAAIPPAGLGLFLVDVWWVGRVVAPAQLIAFVQEHLVGADG